MIAAAVGAVLAAIALGSRSLWLDEGSSFAYASQHGAALWHAVAHDGGNMLGYYLLLHVVISWFGDATWVLRLPSLIANAVTGGLVAALALLLFPGNRRLATAAGLLAVISLPLVFWGQNARGYALLVTLATASFLALIAILQTPPARAPARGAVVAYVLTTLAALYVGYDVALLTPAQLALLLVFRERARLVLACLALVAVLCVPLLVLAAGRGSGQLFWVTPLDFSTAGQAAVTLLSAAMPPNFHGTATTVPTVIVLGLALLAAIALAVRNVISASGAGQAGPGRPAPTHRADAWPLLAVLAWLLIPSVLAVALYAAGEPIELTRVTILVMPAVALLLAWMLTLPRLPPAASAFLLTVVLVLRLAQVVPSYGASPENWKAATAYVLGATTARQQACVAFYPQDGREAFDYYLRARAVSAGDPAPSLRPVLPALPWRTVRPYVEDYGTLGAAQLRRVAAQCPRLWLIASHQGQRHGTRRSRINFARFQTLEQDLGTLYPHSDERTFGWASAIRVTRFW